MTELCEVVITAPDPDWLYTFARKLVEDRLAASAHNFTPVRSIYRWQGQVHERAERMSRVLLNLGWRPPVTIRPPSCPHSGLRD